MRELGLPMTIDDAEWTFDKLKLTLFYSASERVDFREFVKKMGSHFKTFLWMQRSDGQISAGGGMSGSMGKGGKGGGGKGGPGGMYGKGGKGIMMMGNPVLANSGAPGQYGPGGM